MAIMNLQQLYRQVLMDHARYPHNRGTLPRYTQQIELLNPTCGDAITVQYLVDEQQTIQDIAFIGHGCNISMASASMMTEALKGGHEPQALALIEAFQQVISGTLPDDEVLNQLGDAALLEGVRQFPARYKCAALAWKAMEKGLTGQQKESEINE